MGWESIRVPRLGRDGMLLLLTAAAGGMDVASYLGLGHVFTAMMTGNTVLLGMALGQGHLVAALRSVIALLGFAAGVAVAALLVLHGQPGKWSQAVTRTLTLEGVLLIVFSLLWHLIGPNVDDLLIYGLIVIASLAMGLQSGAVHRLRVAGVMTTYITGTLTSLMTDVAGRLRRVEQHAGTRQLGLLASVFLAYGLGALVGAFLYRGSPSLMTVFPVLAVWLVVVNAAMTSPRGEE